MKHAHRAVSGGPEPTEEGVPMMGTCYYCGLTDRQLRPYGPGGSNVCNPCVRADPERNRKAQNSFGALLNAAAEMSPLHAAVIGTDQGPQPYVDEAPPKGGGEGSHVKRPSIFADGWSRCSCGVPWPCEKATS